MESVYSPLKRCMPRIGIRNLTTPRAQGEAPVETSQPGKVMQTEMRGARTTWTCMSMGLVDYDRASGTLLVRVV